MSELMKIVICAVVAASLAILPTGSFAQSDDNADVEHEDDGVEAGDVAAIIAAVAASIAVGFIVYSAANTQQDRRTDTTVMVGSGYLIPLQF